MKNMITVHMSIKEYDQDIALLREIILALYK